MTRVIVPAALFLGMGLAGLADGIFLHQILQWHHMICQETHCASATVAELRAKTVVDGWFHAACWTVLVVTVELLRRLPPIRAGRLWGSVFTGAGGFNLLEGVVDHHVLGIHHVRFGQAREIWDLTFLAFSAALLAVGLWLARRST